jgi:hypothetical protein
MKSFLKAAFLCTMALSLSSCAKLPSSGVGERSTRVLFTIAFQQPINNNYVYFVALRPSKESNPTENGPIPIVAPPWGNGFVGGEVTHFMRYSIDQFPNYQLYEFTDGTLLNYRPIGIPINYLNVNPGDRELVFEIDLAQLAPTLQDALEFKSLQVNILTMDRIPQGTSGSKNWDALGNGALPSEINSPITIPLQTASVYDNKRFLGLEPSGDVIDPSLDIVDFRIEVNPQ